MLLQRLRDYADTRMDPKPVPLYAREPIRYIITINLDGRVLTRRPTDLSQGPKGREARGQRRPRPVIVRGVDIKPLVLADTVEYVFGLARDGKNPARAAESHRTFIDIVDRCAAATGEPSVLAVSRFLHNDPAGQVELPPDYDQTATFTFEVDTGAGTVMPIDLPSVQQFWLAEHDPEGKSAPVLQCIVCGEERPVLATLPQKIKGVPGGQMAGTSIISANAAAFESYGLEQSFIAPVCLRCAEWFTQAANELLYDSTNSLRISDAAVFIFWTREQVDFSLSTFLSDPQPAQVKALLDSAQEGRPVAGVDDTAFYAAVFSGSGGRTVVRDWIDTTVGSVKSSLARWFGRQAIVGYWGDEPGTLRLLSLAAGTVRKLSDATPGGLKRRELRDIAPALSRLLFNAALTGSPLPRHVLAQTIRRIRADQDVDWAQAALIKLVLCGDDPTLEETMVQLDPGNISPAYRCGRLLAVLEQIQREALPGVNATIVDRFFGTASSAPASVFSRLVRGAQPHLSKLERDRPGAYRALQARMEEVLSGLADFPRVLMLEDQGRFALGYYHQRAHDRAQARDAAERRRAERGASAPDTTATDDTTDTTTESNEESE